MTQNFQRDNVAQQLRILYLIFRRLKLAMFTLKGGATLKQCVAKMNAQGWMYCVVLVVLFVSSNGKNTSNPNIIPNSQGLACGQAPAWVLGELAEYSLGRVG